MLGALGPGRILRPGLSAQATLDVTELCFSSEIGAQISTSLLRFLIRVFCNVSTSFGAGDCNPRIVTRGLLQLQQPAAFSPQPGAKRFAHAASSSSVMLQLPPAKWLHPRRYSIVQLSCNGSLQNMKSRQLQSFMMISSGPTADSLSTQRPSS